MDLVVELLLEHWDMLQPHPPNLVITVIGGAKNFRLDGKKKEIFNRGLVNVSSASLFQHSGHHTVNLDRYPVYAVFWSMYQVQLILRQTVWPSYI